MQRQRQWEAELAREAPSLLNEPVEEDHDATDLLPSSNVIQIVAPSTQQPMLDEVVDELLHREDAELEALLTYLPDNKEDMRASADDSMHVSKHFGSDDDDYDALFYEAIDMTDGARQHTADSAENGEAMDLS